VYGTRVMIEAFRPLYRERLAEDRELGLPLSDHHDEIMQLLRLPGN
jgi:hypothetical protein